MSSSLSDLINTSISKSFTRHYVNHGGGRAACTMINKEDYRDLSERN